MSGMGVKRYEYKVYTGSTYQSSLSNVVSDFNYNQTINTIGVEINVDIGLGFNDADAEVDADILVTQDNDFIVTETNNNIATRLDYVFNNAPLELANRLKVIEFSELYPNGIQVFDGIITKWATNLSEDKIQLTAFSYGYQLNQYILSETGDLTIDQSEYDDSILLLPSSGKDPGNDVAQTFQVAIDTDIGSIDVYMKESEDGYVVSCALYLYEGTPDDPGALLSIVEKPYVRGDTFHAETFDFGETISLIANQDYFFKVINTGAYTSFYRYPEVAYSTSDLYADGSFWTYDGSWTNQTTQDMAFAINASQGSVLYSFSNIDSGGGIRQAMALFNNQGGLVTYTEDTVIDSGVNMYYNFNIATVKEIIDKALSVSPASYFYYVDPGTNVLYFKDRSISYDHLLKRGYELSSIAIERTMDELQNTVYFSGGDTGAGENLLIVQSNTASANSYGRWTTQLSDNRVTVQATAEKFAQATLDANSEPKYRLVAEVISDRYDTSTINLGDMVKIANNGNLIDDLLLQVVEKTVNPYSVILKLGSIQPRTTSTIERLSQQLALQEKENNPDVVA